VFCCGYYLRRSGLIVGESYRQGLCSADAWRHHMTSGHAFRYESKFSDISDDTDTDSYARILVKAMTPSLHTKYVWRVVTISISCQADSLVRLNLITLRVQY